MYGQRPSALIDEFRELDALTRWRIDIASSEVLHGLDAKEKKAEWRQSWGLLFIALCGQKVIEDDDDDSDGKVIDLS